MPAPPAQPATVHLIAGPTGAGKTTLSQALCAEYGAVHFSIDEWMATLFMPDVPDPLTFDWAWPRVQRCEAQIWQTGLALLAQGTAIVLDLGLTTRDHRQRLRDWAAAAQVPVVLHYVDADRATRLVRVMARNRQQGDTYAITVTEGMFDFMEQRIESPHPTEQAVMHRTD